MLPHLFLPLKAPDDDEVEPGVRQPRVKHFSVAFTWPTEQGMSRRARRWEGDGGRRGPSFYFACLLDLIRRYKGPLVKFSVYMHGELRAFPELEDRVLQVLRPLRSYETSYERVSPSELRSLACRRATTPRRCSTARRPGRRSFPKCSGWSPRSTRRRTTLWSSASTSTTPPSDRVKAAQTVTNHFRNLPAAHTHAHSLPDRRIPGTHGPWAKGHRDLLPV